MLTKLPFELTDEQRGTVDAVASGANVLCTARAGAGKTTTAVAASAVLRVDRWC